MFHSIYKKNESVHVYIISTKDVQKINATIRAEQTDSFLAVAASTKVNTIVEDRSAVVGDPSSSLVVVVALAPLSLDAADVQVLVVGEIVSTDSVVERTDLEETPCPWVAANTKAKRIAATD